MKCFVIYTSPNPKSAHNAQLCKDSFSPYNSWEVELYDGCSPLTLNAFEEKYPLSDERNNVKRGEPPFITKKCCFYSHFSLWLRCVELQQPIAIVEHDTACVGELPAFSYDDGVTQLTAETMLNSNKTYQGRTFPQDYKTLITRGPGKHPIHFSQQRNGYPCIAGCTGYIMSPSAATILAEDCFKHGWYQNDLLIRTEFFPVYYIMPSPIAYCPDRELRSSTRWPK